MREPTLAWWPGTIPPGRLCTGLGSTLDIMPTCLELAGLKPPEDRVLDGVSLMPMLTGKGKSGRDAMFFYRGQQLYAVRKGPWKMHFITQSGYRDKPVIHDPPALYHLDNDPSEQFDVSKKNPQVIGDILKVVAEHKATLKPPPSQLEIPGTKAVFTVGKKV